MRPIDADFAREKVNWFGGGAPWSTESVLAMLESCPTIAPPPNDLLTLEELREMDGEPVWCVDGRGNQCWCLTEIINAILDNRFERCEKLGGEF